MKQAEPAPSQEQSCWYKLGWLWTGDSTSHDSVKRDVYLQTEHGILTAITHTPPAKFIDWSDSALIPPLVNAHCHLEFSHLSKPLEPMLPFSNWIGKTVQERRANPDIQSSISQGIDESAKAGISNVFETVTTDNLCSYQTSDEQLQLTLFREVLAFSNEQATSQTKTIQQFLSDNSISSVKGISPHAPYTVSPDHLHQFIQASLPFACPIMMHLAETRAERELLRHQRGELVEMLQRLELWRPNEYSTGVDILDYLRKLSQAPHVLLAHGNYLSPEEIDFLSQQPQFSVVYCPRTHHNFGHNQHPWQTLLKKGIRVALGTDGRGSNPNLSVWEEAQFLQQKFPEANPLTILTLATVNGGLAIGKDWTLKIGQPAQVTKIFSASENRLQFSDAASLLRQKTAQQSVKL